MDINDEYSIICELKKGSYLYKLFYKGENIYNLIDKYKPCELPRKGGNIKFLMDKINYNIVDEKQLKYQKQKDLDKIINELKITLKNDEVVFDDYQMTHNRVYTRKNNILFNFMIQKVELNNDILKIKFKNSMEEFELEDTLDNILKELNKKHLINKSIINYHFIFNTLLTMVIENENKG